MNNKHFYIGSISSPYSDYEEENWKRCIENNAHIMHEVTAQKGEFEYIKPNDIIFLKYQDRLIAFGEIDNDQPEIIKDEQLKGWNHFIKVKQWFFYSKDRKSGASNYGVTAFCITGNKYATIKEIKSDYALRKMEEIVKNSGEGVELYNRILNEFRMNDLNLLLEQHLNIILQGAPGTGKTYNTAALALSVCGINASGMNHRELMTEYETLHKQGRIEFVTFHQSMDYEDFVEGLKPVLDEGNVTYAIENGIFKRICEKASSHLTISNFDEVFNQLITELINAGHDGDNPFTLSTPSTKRLFGVSVNSRGNLSLFTGNPLKKQGTITKENLESRINGNNDYIYWDSYFMGIIQYLKEKYNLKQDDKPTNNNYVLIIDEINRGNISKIFGELITLLEVDKRSGGDHHITVRLPYSKKEFSVPSNLYIIGTMNTTDRSVGSIDYAIRRRFAFYTMESKHEIIKEYYSSNEELQKLALSLFRSVKSFIIKNKIDDMSIKDLMVGHSYFMSKDGDLLSKWKYEIFPLLMEYYKDGICSKAPLEDMDKFIKDNPAEEDSL